MLNVCHAHVHTPQAYLKTWVCVCVCVFSLIYTDTVFTVKREKKWK